MDAKASTDSVQIAGGPHFTVKGGDTLLKAALRAGVGFPYECSVGSCGSCKFDLVDGEVRSLWPDAPGLTPRDHARGKHLACQCVPEGRVEVKVRLDAACVPLISPARFGAVLESVVDVTHDLREFSFRAPGAARFMPGQYALLQFPSLGQQRAYSMSNLPNDEGRWQFIVRRVANGRATAHLFGALRPGDELQIDGPFGMAYLRPPERDMVCVAGGSGLAPMLSIARAAAPLLAATGRTLHFFYGARTSRDLAARELLAELPGFGQQIHCEEVLSDALSDGSWAGERGFVHETVDARLGNQLVDHELYFAGPPPMTQAMLDLAMVRRSVPFAQVHYDRFF